MSRTDPPDADLVARLRAGDGRAADVLLARHRGMVNKLAAKLRVPNYVERDDLKQEGYLAILRSAGPNGWSADKIGPHGKPNKFSTYIYVAVWNAMLREAERQTTGRASADPDVEADTLPQPDRPAPDPADLPPLAESLAAMILGDGADPVSLGKAAKLHGLSVHQARRVLAAYLGIDPDADRESA